MNTLKKKLSYIWDYYKTAIIGIPLGILFLIYVISAFTRPNEAPFSIYVINQDVTIEACDALKKDILRTVPTLKKGGDAYVDASLIMNPNAPDADSQMSFTTAIAGHTIDIMISDTVFYEHYAKMDAFADLSEILPTDLYNELIPRLIMAENEEGISIPYGIDVSASPFLSNLDLDTPVLTIAKYSEHQDICIEWIRLLFLQ